MNSSKSQSRRSVLDFGLKTVAAYGLSSLAGPLASAASTSNRAAVCLYLLGGNDSNNMVVPVDAGYDTYAKGRGPLAIPKSSLLSLNSSAPYGFHPNLPGLRDLFNQGALAVVANVGRAASPVSAAQVKSNPVVPSDLFLHTGASMMRYLPGANLTLSWAPTTPASDRASLPVTPLERGATMAPRNSLSAKSAIALSRVTGFPQTGTGLQLKSVVHALAGGAGQRLFFCPVSGFDTHGANQMAAQAALFSEVDDALVAFYNAVQELGMADRVTLFTQTEFNRTLAPNRIGGSDHGWGGHQLVLGRPVMGAQVYGRFPSLELGGADDFGKTGIWVPSVSDVQYHATIANWLGMDDLTSLAAFSNLRSFNPANLGFLLE